MHAMTRQLTSPELSNQPEPNSGRAGKLEQSCSRTLRSPIGTELKCNDGCEVGMVGAKWQSTPYQLQPGPQKEVEERFLCFTCKGTEKGSV